MEISEYNLRRLLRRTAREAAEQVLLQEGVIKTTMTFAEAKRRSSRNAVEKAVRDGKLKFTQKGKIKFIQREIFNDWKFQDSYE